MRLLGVNGVWCFDNPVVPVVARAIAYRAPIADIQNTEERGMLPIDIPRMIRYRDALVQRYDDGMESLIVGHSLGGVIACAIAQRLRNTPVVGIVTINSPHNYVGYTRVLGARGDLPAPIVTFQSSHDRVVLWGTRHPAAKRHVVLDADHWRNIATTAALSEKIARDACDALFARHQPTASP
jgi:pimeloyl-ACP methyl ester carboxylesterase